MLDGPDYGADGGVTMEAWVNKIRAQNGPLVNGRSKIRAQKRVALVNGTCGPYPGGFILTHQVMREALQGLPEIGEDDPLGLSLAGFLEPSSVLECVSFRACAISRFELGPMSTALAKCPWQLRALNLWDNRICDKGAELLAFALDAYRGLEYLGLGRNRITEQGLRALCQPFQPCPLALEEVPAAKERISKQQAAAKAVAEAKEKHGRRWKGSQKSI